MYSLLINEFAKETMERGRHGVQLIPDLIEIVILMFVDDVILASGYRARFAKPVECFVGISKTPRS